VQEEFLKAERDKEKDERMLRVVGLSSKRKIRLQVERE
jgi:hypothetical protein